MLTAYTYTAYEVLEIDTNFVGPRYFQTQLCHLDMIVLRRQVQRCHPLAR
jgi:hypothetical protein